MISDLRITIYNSRSDIRSPLIADLVHVKFAIWEFYNSRPEVSKFNNSRPGI